MQRGRESQGSMLCMCVLQGVHTYVPVIRVAMPRRDEQAGCGRSAALSPLEEQGDTEAVGKEAAPLHVQPLFKLPAAAGGSL